MLKIKIKIYLTDDVNTNMHHQSVSNIRQHIACVFYENKKKNLTSL